MTHIYKINRDCPCFSKHYYCKIWTMTMNENKKNPPLTFWVDIKKILLRDWDPIGISLVSEVKDDDNEYDSYIPDVYALLNSGKNVDEISKYLMSVEINRMGITPDQGEDMRVNKVAEKLVSIFENHGH